MLLEHADHLFVAEPFALHGRLLLVDLPVEDSSSQWPGSWGKGQPPRRVRRLAPGGRGCARGRRKSRRPCGRALRPGCRLSPFASEPGDLQNRFPGVQRRSGLAFALRPIERLAQRDRFDLIEVRIPERVGQDADRPTPRAGLSASRTAPLLASDVNAKHRVAHRPEIKASATTMRRSTLARAGERPELTSTRARASGTRASSSVTTLHWAEWHRRTWRATGSRRPMVTVSRRPPDRSS